MFFVEFDADAADDLGADNVDAVDGAGDDYDVDGAGDDAAGDAVDDVVGDVVADVVADVAACDSAAHETQKPVYR